MNILISTASENRLFGTNPSMVGSIPYTLPPIVKSRLLRIFTLGAFWYCTARNWLVGPEMGQECRFLLKLV